MGAENVCGGKRECGNEDRRRSKTRLRLKRSHISLEPHLRRNPEAGGRLEWNETLHASEELDNMEEEARGLFPNECGIHQGESEWSWCVLAGARKKGNNRIGYRLGGKHAYKGLPRAV